jgi:hypothetical protein
MKESIMRKVGIRLLWALSVVGALVATTSIGVWWAVQVHAHAQPIEPLALSLTGGELKSREPSLTQGGAVTVTLPLVTRNHTPAASIFGVQMSAATKEQGLVEATAAGMRWIRLLAFRWDEIEPVHTVPPTYNWSVVDEQSLLNARANGMEPIVIIHSTPSWAQALAGYTCGPMRQDALDEFAGFLKVVVTRYGSPPFNVRYWELWNEPDVDPSLTSPTSGWGCWGQLDDEYYGGRYYGEMLKAAYPAIKAVQPGAQVLIGGLLLDCDPVQPPPGKNCASAKFLEGILVGGGGLYFDIVNFHGYTYYFEEQDEIRNPNWPDAVTAIPEKTRFLQDVLSKYGFGDKRLMNTEAALLCFQGTPACWAAQARYMPRAYSEAYAQGLQAQIHFKMIQGEHWYNTGLLWYGLNPKPAYYAYAAASEFLSGATYDGTAAGYPAGISGYTFKRSYGLPYVDVLWSANGTTRTVTLPAGASAYNFNGNLFAFWGDIQVTDEPVYIVRP